jgi:hypothetical protein
MCAGRRFLSRIGTLSKQANNLVSYIFIRSGPTQPNENDGPPIASLVSSTSSLHLPIKQHIREIARLQQAFPLKYKVVFGCEDEEGWDETAPRWGLFGSEVSGARMSHERIFVQDPGSVRPWKKRTETSSMGRVLHGPHAHVLASGFSWAAGVYYT